MAKPDKLMQQWMKNQLATKSNQATAMKDFCSSVTTAAHAIGWNGTVTASVHQFAYLMEFDCSHGTHYAEQITGKTILFAQNPEALVKALVSRLPLACPEEHEPAPIIDYVSQLWDSAQFTVIPAHYVTWGGGFTSYSGYGSNSVVSGLAKLVPAISGEAFPCPVDECAQRSIISSLIPHINDLHKWSREAIADWLDSLDVDLTIRPVDKETQECPSESMPSEPLPVAVSDMTLTVPLSWYSTLTLGKSSLIQTLS